MPWKSAYVNIFLPTQAYFMKLDAHLLHDSIVLWPVYEVRVGTVRVDHIVGNAATVHDAKDFHKGA